MGTNYMLLTSARCRGEALTAANALKGELCCDHTNCYGNKCSEKSSLVLFQISGCFYSVDLPSSAIPFPISENRDNSIILWHRAPLKMHPLVLAGFLAQGKSTLEVCEWEQEAVWWTGRGRGTNNLIWGCGSLWREQSRDQGRAGRQGRDHIFLDVYSVYREG